MGKKIVRFEDLECWREARILMKLIYQTTNTPPFSKDFGLKDQIQRSSISIMANIAEGFENISNKEFIRFLGYSLRSSAEVRSHLYAALDIDYITKGEFARLFEQATKCSNYIKAFMRYLKSTL
jgi:four helix bundle protein